MIKSVRIDGHPSIEFGNGPIWSPRRSHERYVPDGLGACLVPSPPRQRAGIDRVRWQEDLVAFGLVSVALAMAIASSLAVGGHLVDSSPLSTIGALAIACAPATEDRRVLFNKVLAWGLSMSVVGALYCYVVFGLLR